MSVALAATWPPRGELPRLQRMVDDLRSLYVNVVLTLPPDTEREIVAALDELPVRTMVTADWRVGKFKAVQGALESDAEAIHYCDFDRLLHWLECFPEELKATVKQIEKEACLILGRTEQAWATHPRCMFETEALFNEVFSQRLGLAADYGAGSRGFSRAAARYIVEQVPAGFGWAVDVGWPLALQGAGFTLSYKAVDGLEWETADQGRAQAADPATRHKLAAEYDGDPRRWQERVAVAQEITRVGLQAAEIEWPDKALVKDN